MRAPGRSSRVDPGSDFATYDADILMLGFSLVGQVDASAGVARFL
jgi:hypothetical protein